MRATIFLADYAEVVNGKIYAMGVGWARIRASQPVNFAIATLIHVPYDQTNKKHNAHITLVTEDGTPYPPDSPLFLDAEFEVGRPPGMRAGEESNVPLAGGIGGMTLLPGGYVIRVELDGEPVTTVPFTATELPL